jgi:hypothetical protein
MTDSTLRLGWSLGGLGPGAELWWSLGGLGGGAGWSSGRLGAEPGLSPGGAGVREVDDTWSFIDEGG